MGSALPRCGGDLTKIALGRARRSIVRPKLSTNFYFAKVVPFPEHCVAPNLSSKLDHNVIYVSDYRKTRGSGGNLLRFTFYFRIRTEPFHVLFWWETISLTDSLGSSC